MNGLWNNRNAVVLLGANLFASIGMGILSLGVAWLLVDRQGGEKLLGIVMIATTILLFLTAPLIGVMIDRFSRRNIMRGNQWFVLLLVTPIAVSASINQGLATWQLVLLYVVSVAYYGVHYPNMLAYVQQLFDKGKHGSMNGLLEVQSQSASMIAGGVGGVLFQFIEPSRVLLVVALGSLISLSLIHNLPKDQPFKIKKVDQVPKVTERNVGLTFIKQNLAFSLVILSLLIPFVTLMVGNYLRPVYLNQTLQVDASIYGYTNMLYSLGACMAGVFVTWLFARFGPWAAVIVSVGFYTSSLFFIALIQFVPLFLLLQLFQGLGNAGSRICKQTIMMARIDNSRIGRVNGVFDAIGMGVRVILLLLFTVSMDWFSTQLAFLSMAIISSGAILMIIANRSQLAFGLKRNTQSKPVRGAS
ncbi:MFS transporter [Alkalihalobacillus sp. FSL W8-0930]